MQRSRNGPNDVRGWNLRMDWERMQTAISLKDSGRFDDALAEYCELSKLASTADENVAALTGKLNCLLHLGRVEEARK